MTNQSFTNIKNSSSPMAVVVFFLFTVWISLPAAAQEGTNPDGPNQEGTRAQQKFQQIDTDGDGSVSSGEMLSHEAEKGKSGGNRFTETDTNGDKEISLEEFIQHEMSKDKEGSRQQPGQDQSPPGEKPGERPDEQPGNNQSSVQQKKYSISQAISHRAQLSTIAFSGLAFLTGDFGAATFIPPGKVCDFFGFQYMRDIDAAGKGHNPMFLNRVAGNVLYVLNDAQKQLFLDLAQEQAPQMEELARMRLSLIKAFHMERDQQIPQGSSGLDKAAVVNQVGEIFAEDARLSLKRAEVMAAVASSLTLDQNAYLAKMKFNDFNTWPAKDEKNRLPRESKGGSKMFNVAYMTYASEFFSWIKGSVEADVYFCPERHGTYFGGFYMKDMPAMGKRDYDISTAITGNKGEAFLDILSSRQQQQITGIVSRQKDALNQTIDIRRAISQELRKYLKGGRPDIENVLALGKRYGELDGEMSYLYAKGFANVNQTLTPDQRERLMTLRDLKGYESAPYYMYSRPARSLPSLDGAEQFFK